MKKIWTLLCCSFLLAFSHTVEFFTTERMTVDSILFKSGYFLLDTLKVPSSQVKKIIFESKEMEFKKPSQPPKPVQEIFKKAKEAEEKFPDAGALLLLDDGKFILHKNGTREYIYHMQAKILRENRKDWANVRLYFEEEENKIDVLFARTIKPDGRVIELKPSQIKITKVPLEKVFFGRGKLITFTLPEVEVGDIIEYSYRDFQFNPANKEIFQGGWYFQGEEPFILSKVMVSIPHKDTLVWAIRNEPKEKLLPVIQKKAGKKIYTWELRNMPPIIEEPNMPPSGEVSVLLEFTNQTSWDKIHDWYLKFQEKRMKITPKIKELAEEITKNAATSEEKIASIYHWVERNIRYISIKGGVASGVSGHPAEYTLEIGYGDCTDKGILFATLLRAIGVDADLVYVGTNDEIPELLVELPSLYGNHAITQIFLPDTSFYLDPTGYYSRYPYFWSANHGVYAVNSSKRRVEKIPIPPPSQNRRTYEYKLTLDKEGDLLTHFESSYTGDYEAGVRGYWDTRKEEDIPNLLLDMVHETSPRAELLSYDFVNLKDISKPFRMVLSYKLKKWAIPAGDLWMIYLPELSRRYNFSELSLSRRSYPLTYSTSQSIVHSVELSLPLGTKIEWLPPPLELNTPFASYRASYSYEKDKIVFQDEFQRWVRKIPVEEYSEYKALCEAIMEYHKKPIILSKKEGGE